MMTITYGESHTDIYSRKIGRKIRGGRKENKRGERRGMRKSFEEK